MQRPQIDFSQLPRTPGIAGRFTDFVAALLEHLLALSSLATYEAKQALKQTLLSCFLLVFTLLLGFITYLLLLAILILIAISVWQFSLLFTLSLIALSHFVIVVILLLFLWRQQKLSLFRLTCTELLHDLETLNRHRFFHENC